MTGVRVSTRASGRIHSEVVHTQFNLKTKLGTGLRHREVKPGGMPTWNKNPTGSVSATVAVNTKRWHCSMATWTQKTPSRGSMWATRRLGKLNLWAGLLKHARETGVKLSLSFAAACVPAILIASFSLSPTDAGLDTHGSRATCGSARPCHCQRPSSPRESPPTGS